jgi:solute carrier family 29 (equilibrative nucleoside transporter) protein 4
MNKTRNSGKNIPSRHTRQAAFHPGTHMLNYATNILLMITGAAGFLISGNRILTKLLLDDPKVNTIIFFVMSIGIVALCFCLHQIVRRTEFVHFYITLCHESRKIVLEPTEDVGWVRIISSYFIL